MTRPRGRTGSRLALAGLLGLGLLGLTDCRDPTEITLHITTDADCPAVRGTNITVGRLGELEQRPNAAATKACSDGRIGSLVVIPSGDNDGEVSIRVVTGIGKSPDACIADGYVGGCIVARRTIRYLPHTPLDMPIEMQLDCLDIPCGVTQTCFDGQCVSPKIDEASCSRGDCRPKGDGGVVDGGTDSPDVTGDVGPWIDDAGDAAETSSDAGADVSASCTMPMAECDGNLSVPCETDTQTDPKHCGACGHECLGGACASGACAPTIVWSKAGAKPTRLAVDDTDVYFVDYNDGNVRRVPKAGGAETTLATGQNSARIALDDAYAYWTDTTGKKVMRVPKAGGTAELLAGSVGDANGLALAGTTLYFTDYTSGGRLGRIPKSGGTPTWLVPAAVWPAEVALTATHAYYTSFQNNGTVRRVALANGAIEDVMAADNSFAIASVGSDVYFTVVGTGIGKGSVVRVANGGPPSTLAAPLKEPRGIAADATHVYFTDLTEKTVRRIAVDGSDNQVSLVLDAANQHPLGIATDDQAIYWADDQAGVIKKLAK